MTRRHWGVVARPVLPAELALAPGQDGALDRATLGAEAEHPGQSAFRLVVEGAEASLVRFVRLRGGLRTRGSTIVWLITPARAAPRSLP